MKVIFIVFIDFDPKPSVKIVWVYFFSCFLNPLKDLYMKHIVLYNLRCFPKPSVKIVWGFIFPFQGYLYALYMKKEK